MYFASPIVARLMLYIFILKVPMPSSPLIPAVPNASSKLNLSFFSLSDIPKSSSLSAGVTFPNHSSYL